MEHRGSGARLALGEQHPAPCELGGGVQHRDVEGVGDLLQLLDALLGHEQVAGRDRDLCRGGEDPGTRDAARPAVGHASADDSGGLVDPALRETQKRGAEAGTAPELLGAGECLLRAVEVTQATADVTHFGETERHVGQVAVEQLLARTGCFRLRVDEIAPQVHHAGAVHTADPREDGERVLLRPLRGHLGPFRSAPEIADLLARADEAAVHLARGVRAEAAFDRGQHRLVDRRESAGRVAGVDQDAPDRLLRLGFLVAGAE
ncbi:MAG: hypothetical protein U0W40_16010 [Acidimicrobiia bacterium]